MLRDPSHQCWRLLGLDRLDLGLEDVRVGGLGVEVNVLWPESTLSIAQYLSPLKKLRFTGLIVRFLSRDILISLTSLLWSKSILNQFLKMVYILLRYGATCFESHAMPAQDHSCMSWLCQMTCCKVFFFSLWLYTCSCISKEGFGEGSSEMLALKPKARFLKP